MVVVVVVVLALVTVAMPEPTRADAAARVAVNPIETAYAARGTWAVTTTTVGSEYVIHHPTDLGAGGFHHPIITWGNGTDAVPSQYPGVLDQLASWGFVVVASTGGRLARGVEMLAGATYLVARNSDSSSIFYGKLDTAAVGAVGHSQGAGGAVNAALRSNGLIRTVVPIALPFWAAPGDEFDLPRLTVPVLLVSGANDWISSPRTITGYYNQVPGPAAKASLKDADHNTIQGSGGGFLGYVTAWFRYRLCDDAVARGAFVGSRPEFVTNSGWTNQAGKLLP
jgi:pimeloyl-ACP methyl ester carboxylesterase